MYLHFVRIWGVVVEVPKESILIHILCNYY